MGLLVSVLVLAGSLVAVSGASASQLLSGGLTASDAQRQSCIAGPLREGPGVVKRSVTVAESGWITARLSAGSGDWDVAIFDPKTSNRIAGSAFFGAKEIAEGFAAAGQRLSVQACRRTGGSDSARLSVENTGVQGGRTEQLSLVKVSTPNEARKKELTELGLDVTEHGGDGFLEIVLHGTDDARALRQAKFTFTTEVADLTVRGLRDRAADRRLAARASSAGTASAAALPSGRASGYRRLDDYNNEMKALAERNPNLVKPISLPFRTATGRTVQGIEIAEDVERNDGRPVFLQMGAHHAREWPSSEHAIEWAHELVNGYRSDNARVRRLMRATRTIVIPIVNPEGFNTSREAASALDNGRGGPNEVANLASPYEYQRKNCRINNTAADDFNSAADDDPPQGDCTQPGKPNVGISQFGVDPNRNYGGFWGGPGASASGEAPGGDFAQDYRGTGPFSEPETRNIRDLVSKRHVVTLISNHTFSNLLLRPPAIAAQGPTFDDPTYKALGREMAGHNGYRNQPSFRLYDTSGGTEDWTYYSTGGFGFTYEIGPGNFHPPYAETIAEYDGTAPAVGAGKGGNREAYFKALESTARAARHSVITGGAPAGSTLRLKKSFKTATSPILDNADEVINPPILFDDTLNTTARVGGTGLFEWHINPSTRPIAAQARGRQRTGEPSPPIVQEDKPPPLPPCPAYFDLGSQACPPTSYQDNEFTVPQNGGGVDNAFTTIEIEWTDSSTDLDMEIYRDANGDGDLGDVNEDNEPESEPIGSSAQGGTTNEKTKIGPDPPPGRYLARVINYAGAEPYDLRITFEGPEPFKPGTTETWTLTCETPDGNVRTTQQLLIARSESKPINFGTACPRSISADAGRDAIAFARRTCLSPRRGIRGKRVGPAALGRTRRGQRRVLRRPRLKSRKGIDRYCVVGGGTLRAGYPTRRLNVGMSSRTRRSIRKRAVLAISTSKRLRLRKLRVGSRTRTLRKRLKGERRIRVGRNVWYTARGKRSRLLFRTRGGRVRELGLGNKRLTATSSGTVRFLRAWDRRGL